MLKIENVYKTFNPGTINEKKALQGINLVLNDGDFVTVIGGNGAGKSTMLNMITGVYPVDSGKIEIDGIDITKQPDYKRAKYFGRVFQDPMMGTAADMQIEENLALALRRGKPRTLKPGITSKERAMFKEILATLDLGLENRLIMMNNGRIVFDVSGEEKSKLTIEELIQKFSETGGDMPSDRSLLQN